MEQKMTGSSMWVLGLVVLALIASPVNAISCEDAATQLLPCLSYLVGDGNATVPVPCCEGAQALNRMISSKDDRQTLCECFKQAAPQIGVKVDRAQQLVKTCQISVGLPVDYNVDCSKV
ncbi:non-specific lipid-transfer protein 1-like [Rhododendron vialii]|uniref:non-specific lipid-transfer protein 1-like n=1 Tax=Rhododendron vialii TaxID=182163 RepID=UPI00265E5437|nr:non-specific lipid-transfer protein 1-like [Rhododendron vialii]